MRRLVLAVFVLASVVAGAPAAHAVVLDQDVTACTATGSMVVSPGKTPLGLPEALSGTVTLTCGTGQGDDDGTWKVAFTAVATNLGCVLQPTTGTWGGSSPEGASSGSFSMTEGSPTGPLTLVGDLATSGPPAEDHSVTMSLTPVYSAPCPPGPSTSATLTGTATIADPGVDADAAVCVATGSLLFWHGLIVIPDPVTVTGSLTLVCVGPGDDAGTWTVSLSGSGWTQDCAVTTATGAWGGTSPEGSASGTFALSQPVGYTPITVTGNLATAGENHSVTIVLQPVYQELCPPSTTDALVAGPAVITD